jgi:hypothetical protein
MEEMINTRRIAMKLRQVFMQSRSGREPAPLNRVGAEGARKITKTYSHQAHASVLQAQRNRTPLRMCGARLRP